jgi:hypothetical protein
MKVIVNPQLFVLISKWEKDKGGDYQLYLSGEHLKEEYAAMICPHHNDFRVLVDGEYRMPFCKTLSEAKKLAERCGALLVVHRYLIEINFEEKT